MNRRKFLITTAAYGAMATLSQSRCFPSIPYKPNPLKPIFKLSLAPWSLMRKPAGESDPNGIPLLDYPMVAAELGFKAVEQDNLHFIGELPDEALISRMKRRTEEAGIVSSLLLCGALGDIADANKNMRVQAIEKYQTWLEAAKFMGCQQMRIVCADHITIPREEKMKYAVEGVSIMADFAQQNEMELLIENHNGYSSDPNWLVEMIKKVGKENCGVLGDFTGWRMEHDPLTVYPDPYVGFKILAPHIKSVGAKSVDFDENGKETNVDFSRMINTLADFEYNGYVAVEYFGKALPRRKGITLTKKLIEESIRAY